MREGGYDGRSTLVWHISQVIQKMEQGPWSSLILTYSFDRYFSVTRPLTYRARRTTSKAALMIFSAWALSAVMWPPWIIAWPHIEGERKVPDNECYIQFIYSNE